MIERDLVARFGEAIRTVPEFKGIGLLVWLGPFAIGLAGVGIVVLVVRKAANANGPPDASESDILWRDANVNERLQYELDALD